MDANPISDHHGSHPTDLLGLLSQIANQLGRIADHFDPPPPDIVGTPYVATKLGCTTDWIAILVREGQIPPLCVIPGTGYGKPWKFRRSRIDQWIERR
jgi:Helix-turn-helix domain